MILLEKTKNIISICKDNIKELVEILTYKNKNLKKELNIINIRNIIPFSILIILSNIINYIVFGSTNFFNNNLLNFLQLIILNLVPIIFIYIVENIDDNRKYNSTEFYYLTFLVIIFNFYFLFLITSSLNTQFLYKFLVLTIILAFGPLLNLKQILLTLTFSLLLPILVIIYFNYPLIVFNNFFILYLFIIIYTQILYIFNKKNLKNKLILEQINKDLLIKVEIDPLTKLYNRYGIQKRLDELQVLKDFYKKSIGVILLDIDYFKNYNDTFGHQEGDNCLRKVSGEIKNSIKKRTDFVARYGGEEFVILLYDVNASTTIKIAKRVCKNIENLKISAGNTKVSQYVTTSAGISIHNPNNKFDFYELVKESDDQLYIVKNDSKNAVAYDNKIYNNK